MAAMRFFMGTSSLVSARRHTMHRSMGEPYAAAVPRRVSGHLELSCVDLLLSSSSKVGSTSTSPGPSVQDGIRFP
jgi:hypothetical protein